MDFERAQLPGNYARMDLFKTRSGPQEITDNVAIAKGRIKKVLKKLGNGREDESFSQSCVWNVVGLGITLEEWTNLVRAAGKGMNADKASGISSTTLWNAWRCITAWSILGRLQTMSNDRSYAKAIQDFFEYAAVASASRHASRRMETT